MHAAGTPASVAEELPQFRQVNSTEATASLRKVRRIRFAIDEQFPPFAYKNSAGALTGLLPLLADSICTELRVTCEYVNVSSTDLETALTSRQVDAGVYLKNTDPLDYEKLDFTRPFLLPFGRFAGRTGSPIEQTDVRSLAGKRIGARAGTSHAGFIERNFPRSLLVPLDSYEALYEAVRTGQVDIVFSDAFRLMFWLQGNSSRGCCHFIGRGYLDRDSFSQGLAYAVRREDTDLRKVLDLGLDRLQTKGRFETVYSRFFPQSPY